MKFQALFVLLSPTLGAVLPLYLYLSLSLCGVVSGALTVFAHICVPVEWPRPTV